LTAILLIWTFEREQRTDLLESVAKEQQVMEEKMLAALLCHEIKNPLNVVKFFLGVLEEEQRQQEQLEAAAAGEAGEVGEGGGSGFTPSSLHDALWLAAQAATASEQSAGISKFLGRQRALLHLLPGAIHCTEALVEIVENCRHLAKVDSGTYAPQEEEIDLRQMAESCLDLYGREREAGLEFDLRCPAELAIVSDRLLWRHVLMNLIGNAVKFTMHKDLRDHLSPPRVVVRIERGPHEQGVLRVDVGDNGPGIDAADQAFILGKLDPFVQVLRGKLDLASPLQADGRGTRFGACASRTLRPPALRHPSDPAPPRPHNFI
jgi:signal transduction histidine kinase